MGMKKTCGKCGQTGHNARTCRGGEGGIFSPVPKINVPKPIYRSGIGRRKVQCHVCREIGHNRKTCPVQKGRDNKDHIDRVARRKLFEEIFLEMGICPGALVNVPCNETGTIGKSIDVPALVVGLVVRYSMEKKDRSTLDWYLQVQKLGNQASYPGIASYYYFGKEDNSQVSLPREVLNEYGDRTGTGDLGTYTSITLLAGVKGCGTFNQFDDPVWMAGNEKL